MRASRLSFYNVLMVASMFLASMLVLPRLPAVIPIHWNIHGHADGFAPRAFAAFLLPVISAGLLALLLAMRSRVNPAARNGYEKVATATIAFLVAVNAIVLAIGLGYRVPMDRAMFILLGGLFAVIGFWMRDLPRNGVVGVKTPWTLRDDRVWTRTHKLAGPLFVGAGMMMVIFSIAGASLPMLLVLIGVLVVVPILYSYLLSRRVF